MNLAIIGATGNVGRKTIEILEKSKIKFSKLFLVASERSEGKKIKFKGNDIEVQSLDKYDFSSAQITFFAAGSKIAELWIPKACKNTIVIDNSKYFRMDKDVPLVVPEVNPDQLAMYKKKNIIANANCSTIQMVLALKPLHDHFNIKQIAFNLIPHIDEFVDDGYTKEEWKMEKETKKILDPKIKITATCVRVPVMVSHSESINVEFEKPFNVEKVRDILSKSEGCKVLDERKNGGYITPLEAENSYMTFISRIRKDSSNDKAINMWVVSDNLLKGASGQAVQCFNLMLGPKTTNRSGIMVTAFLI